MYLRLHLQRPTFYNFLELEFGKYVDFAGGGASAGRVKSTNRANRLVLHEPFYWKFLNECPDLQTAILQCWADLDQIYVAENVMSTGKFTTETWKFPEFPSIFVWLLVNSGMIRPARVEASGWRKDCLYVGGGARPGKISTSHSEYLVRSPVGAVLWS